MASHKITVTIDGVPDDFTTWVTSGHAAQTTAALDGIEAALASAFPERVAAGEVWIGDNAVWADRIVAHAAPPPPT